MSAIKCHRGGANCGPGVIPANAQHFPGALVCSPYCGAVLRAPSHPHKGPHVVGDACDACGCIIFAHRVNGRTFNTHAAANAPATLEEYRAQVRAAYGSLRGVEFAPLGATV